MAESAYFKIPKIERGHDSGVSHSLVSGNHNNQPTMKLNLSHVSNTRGDTYIKCNQHTCNLRKHFFSYRIIEI